MVLLLVASPHMLTDILLVDYAVDFHAGGASRFNAPQIRLAPNNPELITLANVLMPHSFSKNVAGSFRNAIKRENVTFEGGKSLDINKSVTDACTRRKATLSHLDMLDLRNTIEQSESTIYIEIVVDPSSMFWFAT
jgi:hypothetical protein